jgi:hypothetical protein
MFVILFKHDKNLRRLGKITLRAWIYQLDNNFLKAFS